MTLNSDLSLCNSSTNRIARKWKDINLLSFVIGEKKNASVQIRVSNGTICQKRTNIVKLGYIFNSHLTQNDGLGTIIFLYGQYQIFALQYFQNITSLLLNNMS